MKAFWNRHLKLNILMIVTAALAVIFSLHAAAQSTRPAAPQQPKPTPRPGKVITSKPAPLPTPKPEKKEPEEDTGSIRITSNLVAVPVSVSDAAGQPVRNLAPTDFSVEEEGQTQRVEFLGEPGKTPVDLALLFDVSGSVRERFQFEQAAVSRFLKSVFRPNDAVTIFSVGQVPKLVTERSSSVEKALTGAMSLEPTKEGTALFDTVGKAIRYLKDSANPGTRRVIIVISDGEDNISEDYNLPQVLRELQQTDCLFYSINPSGPSIRLNNISMRGQANMVSMANTTGGYAFLPEKLEDLGAVFQQIATELQAQYLLGYYPTDERTDGKFRRIAVKVPRRPELRIRARQGYYAPKA
ncbi:MAG TPA: VWA domain-containing protein [Blastocatellia bacterium]|nr:VWA domain-containing protein [Blastocatellia bacterium]